MQARSLLESVLSDAKAEDIVAIDLRGKAALTDWMILATARSQRHLSAIRNNLARTIKSHRFPICRDEGDPQTPWAVVDAGDVVVHIFRAEARAMYRLDILWGDEALADEVPPSA